MVTVILRLVVTVLVFIVLVVVLPLAFLYVRGDLNGRASGLGAVAGGPGLLVVLSIAAIVSAILSTLIIRD